MTIDVETLVFPLLRLSDDEAVRLEKRSWLEVMSRKEMLKLMPIKHPWIIDSCGRIVAIQSVTPRRLSFQNLAFPRSLLWIVDVELVSLASCDVRAFARSIAERARRFRWRIPTGEGRERYLDAIESVSTVDELFAEVSYFGNADL